MIPHGNLDEPDEQFPDLRILLDCIERFFQVFVRLEIAAGVKVFDLGQGGKPSGSFPIADFRLRIAPERREAL